MTDTSRTLDTSTADDPEEIRPGDLSTVEALRAVLRIFDEVQVELLEAGSDLGLLSADQREKLRRCYAALARVDAHLARLKRAEERSGEATCRWIVLLDVPGRSLPGSYRSLRALLDGAQEALGAAWPGFETGDADGDAFGADGEPVTAEEIQAARACYYDRPQLGRELEGGADATH